MIYQELAQDEIIMYNYKQVTVNLNNLAGAIMPLKLVQEPFGKIAPFAPDPESGWQYSALEGAYYYALPAAGGTISVAISLVEENNGGHIKLETYYYMVQNPGTDDQLAEKVTLDTFEFDIVNFKILAIWFENGVSLNIDGNRQVPKPEWYLSDGRIAKPEVGEQYSSTTRSTTSAPAAVVREQKVKLTVIYECHGEDEIKLSAICDVDSQPSCIYGNTIMPWTTISCAAGPALRTFDVQTLYSSTVVRASLIHIVWNTKDAKIGSRINTTTEYNVDTWHRIYTLNSSPKRIGFHLNASAWLPIVEFGANLAAGATGDLTVRVNLQKGIFNSSWKTKDIYFMAPLASIYYNAAGSSFIPDYVREIGFAFWTVTFTTPFYLPSLLDTLQSEPNLPKGFDCFSYNGLFVILSNQIGSNLYGRYIRQKQEYSFDTKCVQPSDISPKIQTFEVHFASTDEDTMYWDASNKYHFQDSETTPCDGDTSHYRYASIPFRIDEHVYLNHFFSQNEFLTRRLFMTSIDKRKSQ